MTSAADDVDRPGILISLDMPEVELHWKDLLLGLGEAAIGTALAITSGGATLPILAKGAMDALRATKASDTVPTRAFVLFATSLVLATSRVVALNENLTENRKEAAKKIFAAPCPSYQI